MSPVCSGCVTYGPVGVGSEEERVLVPVRHQDVLRLYRLVAVHVPVQYSQLESRAWAPAYFDKESDPLLWREGTSVCVVCTQKRGVESRLNTGGLASFGVYSMSKTGGRRNLFVTRASGTSCC